MAAIVFDKVSKRFADGLFAVKSLDLEIADGEFLVLVGPSGCGKSTALRMIAGLEEISEGRLLIDGAVANGLSPRDRDVAMVFQSYALYPHMTVRENIGFGLLSRGARKPEVAAKVQETARLLELEPYLDRKPAQLSGGQRQRVAMGRAIARRPKAFLMDEPLSNLDARLRGHMRAEIARLQAITGVTTVYVTHDQIEAMTMGDRVAVMRHGELQQLGAPRGLYDAPANLFVAGFIGAPAMNVLGVEIAAADGGAEARAEGFRLPLPPEFFARRPALQAYIGRTALLGVRPEAFALAAEGGALVGRVAFVEDFGATQLAHLDIDAGLKATAADPGETVPQTPRLRALLDAAIPLRAGERLRLDIDARRVHVFDAVSEHAI